MTLPSADTGFLAGSFARSFSLHPLSFGLGPTVSTTSNMYVCTVSPALDSTHVASRRAVFGKVKAGPDSDKVPIPAELTGGFEIDALHAEDDFVLIKIVAVNQQSPGR